jgi:hypothetical protein
VSYIRKDAEYIGELHGIDSEQYGCGCAVAFWGNTADEVIEYCRAMECTVDSGDGEQFCVALRPEVGPELWTETALRRSLDKRVTP